MSGLVITTWLGQGFDPIWDFKCCATCNILSDHQMVLESVKRKSFGLFGQFCKWDDEQLAMHILWTFELRG